MLKRVYFVFHKIYTIYPNSRKLHLRAPKSECSSTTYSQFNV